ncbi:MAG: SAM-dependent chlorinase/fluorinase [Deltaproteobacteria bacterium]|nr:SAM-dependent chlorinase/fluorinase [Deltaproteobacteria bacterium]MBI3296188.1 SAM-dependent chlorinase/fluorinase [Deltaproteobacteria bacterium]
MSVVTLLTDFGTQDSYVAEVKAVLLGVPKVQLVDLTHEIPPYDIEAGAFQLWRAYRHFPPGTWHLCVVDPGVGSERRPLYVKTKNHHFVGPDNGLLSWAVRDVETQEKTAGKYFQIPSPKKMLTTFHGRDLFAPFIRDRLKGKSPKITSVLTISGGSFPLEEKRGDRRVGHVLYTDHYGNLVTTLSASEGAAFAEINHRQVFTAPSYSAIPEGSVALVAGSHGLWELAAREDSAAKNLRAKKGDVVTLTLT